MALEIKQNLKLSQQLVITPQLQQAIKLLQLTRLELQNVVQNELLENPMLEEKPEEDDNKDDEVSVTEPMTPEGSDQKTEEVGTKDGELKEPTNFDWENYIENYSSAESGAGKSAAAEFSDEPPMYENVSVTGDNLQDHLIWQLHMGEFYEDEIPIIEDLIGNVNDEGYINVNLEEMAQKHSTEISKVEEMLALLQEFDPPGVASRNLKECLRTQVKPFERHERELLYQIIDNHLEDLEKKNYIVISKTLKISMDRLKELAHIITTLEPKPGRPFGTERPQYISPDVFVEKIGNEYIIVLNDDGLPKLQVSNFYRNALFQKDMPSQAKEYIQDKLRSAMWLIKSIHQRQRTLYKVTSSIVKFQKEFLENGVSSLKPMVLKDVADDIGMHESTISRVTTNKYVQTPRGLFELKFFFNSKVPSGTADGLTAEAVKEQIRKLIAAENQHKPFSDQEITNILQKENIQIARRTVAKYREMLGILPASRRKQVFS